MHGHSHSHSHSHYDPNRQSTLLNPVKNVELYRVSEETRQRVATDSSRIEAENKHLYEVSRKRIMRKEADRLRVSIEYISSIDYNISLWCVSVKLTQIGSNLSLIFIEQ